MIITESKLRDMVKASVSKLIRETLDNDEWYQKDEFDDETEIDDENISIEPEDKPEDEEKAMAKKDKAEQIIKNILAKQGYKGDALEREVEKRMAKNKVSPNSAMVDSFYNNVDDIWVDGHNYGMVDSSAPYDGAYDDLYESDEKQKENDAQANAWEEGVGEMLNACNALIKKIVSNKKRVGLDDATFNKIMTKANELYQMIDDLYD